MTRRAHSRTAIGARQRLGIAWVLALFALVQVAFWAHRGLVEHAACETHLEVCHVDLAQESRPSDEAPRSEAPELPAQDGDEDHTCLWQGFFRERAELPVAHAFLDGPFLEVAFPAPVSAPAWVRYQEGLHLLAPKGSPPA